MKRTPKHDSTTEFERALERSGEEEYILRLYVTGMTEKSKHAIQNIKRICEDHLKGSYELEIIDIYRHPVLAKGDQIVATPTLIKKLPMPMRRFIGDMSETEKILMGLDLRQKSRTLSGTSRPPKRKGDHDRRQEDHEGHSS